MRRLITIGRCEFCGERFMGNQYPTVGQRRYCSRRCKEKAYKRLPEVRFKLAAAKRKRRDQKKRIAMRELLEAMQREVPI